MSALKDLRLKHSLTEQELADKANVTRNYIVRLEQSLYELPSTSVLYILSQLDQVPLSAVGQAYAKDRAAVTKPLMHLVSESMPNWSAIYSAINNSLDRHPHITFRELVFSHYNLPISQIKFAQYTGLHPATLSKYETTAVGVMPSSIRQVDKGLLLAPLGVIELIDRLGQNRFRELKEND